jgi:Schlafen, AlbA_2
VPNPVPPARSEQYWRWADMTNRNVDEGRSAALDAATRRAARGPSARLALVRAVRDSGLVATEADWIEWKSRVDLHDRRSRMDHVVRHVLGFTNRDPGRAANVAEGCAYLLLGVEPGGLHGVERIDPATLESWMLPYLGPDLQWDAAPVDLDGKTVLVITVEAPRWGDSAFPLRKALDPYADGTIFVRRLGKTERASAAEIDQLFARAARGAQVLQVSLGWWSSPGVVTPIEIPKGAIQAWIEAERERVTPSVLRRKESMTREALVLATFSGIRADGRSSTEYLQEVEEYLGRAALALPRQIHRAVVHKGLAAIDLAIENRTMHNFPSVEVRLTFPPIVTAYLDEEDAISDEDIPARPRPYGESLLPGLPPYLRRSAIAPLPSDLKFPGPHSYIEQSSRTIHFAPVHYGQPAACNSIPFI